MQGAPDGAELGTTMETLTESSTPGGASRPKQTTARSKRVKSQRSSPSIVSLIQDLVASFRAPGFWLYGAWIDTSLEYRAQALGAFWGVAGTLLFVVLLGTLYSHVLPNRHQSFYVHLATGYVLWVFMQQTLSVSARIYTSNRSMIENGYVKYPDYMLRMFCAELNSLALNLIVVVGAVVLSPISLTAAPLVLFLTIPLFFAAILGICFFCSVLGARYADFAELLRTALRLGFFITPIIWVPGAAGGKSGAIGAFVYANPFYYLIEIVRAPLMSGEVPWLEIGVVTAAIPIIWFFASYAYARARPYLPLWL